MRFVIQRVMHSKVTINGEVRGQIGKGFMVLIGVGEEDTVEIADKMIHKMVNMRIFEDENGKMNKSLTDIGGDILIVSQFTLAAETSKGLRPSFTTAADPETGKKLYEHFVSKVKESGLRTETGEFGAYMQVALVNDGPVTIWLKC